MPRLDIEIYEKVLKANPWLSEIVLRAEDGVDRISMRFPSNVNLSDIAKALEHSAFFLAEDMPLEIPADKREDILRLYQDVAREVGSWKERE